MRSSLSEKEENIKNTKILIAYFIVIFVVIGILISIGCLLLMGNKNFTFMSGVYITTGFLAVSALYSIIAYYLMNKILVGSVRGQQVNEDSNSQLYNIVEELCLAIRLPMPTIYIVNDPSPNAFATGRDPEHATVSVTQGLLDLMNREELEAVIGHELSHIKNYDIRVSALAATLSSVIVGVGASMIMFARVVFESQRWSGGDEDDRKLQLVMALVAFGVLILGVIVKFIGVPLARLIEYSISREREYLADVSSTTITHNPEGMIKALKKLQSDTTPTNQDLTSVKQLCLITPQFKQRGKRISKFKSRFDTHPPLEDRITRLQALLNEQEDGQ